MLAIILIAAVSLILTVVLIALVAALLDHQAFARDVQILHANACRGSAHALPITAADLAGLPDPVQLYLATAGVIGRPRIHGATVFHGGSFCTQPGAEWLPLTGECHYAATPPAFLWWGRIPIGLGLSVGAQDRYAAGHGRMFVRINSLWPIADAQGAEIAQSALGRLLAEGPLLPTALLPTFIGSVARDTAPSGISWEAVDVHTARATLRDGDLTATALFHFGPDHLIERVTLDRYRAAGDRTVLTPFAGRLSDYRDFDGLLLPTQLEAAWVLPGGEFPFARFSITGVRFDDPRGPAELERAETEASVHGRQAAREQPRPTAVGAARVRAELAVK